MRSNVVLVVLDTLRSDYSGGLDRLVEEFGFEKVEEAIAPSSWTLPSHVSMLTGMLPSRHGVHEGRELRPRDLAGIARARLPSAANVLKTARECGYTSFCATGNPFVSPVYGFQFDHYREFRETGEISAHALEVIGASQRDLVVASRLLMNGALRDVARLFDYRVRQSFGKVLGSHQMEKGSKFILDYVLRTGFPTPFFLFINLMEAHEAYTWGEDFMKTVGLSALGRKFDGPRWKDAYPRHADLAVERAIEAVSGLLKFDPMIIVTSDHGQLLGEDGRYGHGFSLDDSLVRVPFYVRWPSSGPRPLRRGKFVGLTDVPGIVSGFFRGEDFQFGSHSAVSESFGYVNDLSSYLAEGDGETLDTLFNSRVRVFAEGGSATYNRDTGQTEDRVGSISDESVRDAVVGSAARSPSPEPARRPSAGRVRSDEDLVLERLKKLGYE